MADHGISRACLIVETCSTAHKGRRNVMAMSWHTMMEFEPPLVGCIVSGRHCSFDALSAGVHACCERARNRGLMRTALPYLVNRG